PAATCSTTTSHTPPGRTCCDGWGASRKLERPTSARSRSSRRSRSVGSSSGASPSWENDDPTGFAPSGDPHLRQGTGGVEEVPVTESHDFPISVDDVVDFLSTRSTTRCHGSSPWHRYVSRPGTRPADVHERQHRCA